MLAFGDTEIDRTRGESAGEAAPQISAETLTSGIDPGLQKIRTRLLDLTNRNRLLNFRHTRASSLRIVNADLDCVFERLCNGNKLTFLPVPEPDGTLEGEESADSEHGKPPASVYAEEIGWNTSYDLDEKRIGEAGPNCLPVLQYRKGLEALTRKIGSAAKTSTEESGANMLYLIFGFLEWYEDENSQTARMAPLFTVPVSLERNGGKGKSFESTLEHSEEDLPTNLSLAEKLRREFSLEIPEVEEGDTPGSYFQRFADILSLQRRWRIRKQITLSLLSFGKLLMYRDLDPKIWPAIAKHSLVKDCFEGTTSCTIERAKEYDIDDFELKPHVPDLICDADSSQHSALIDAMRGQNLVIEGPPGTGKSQTITNLIAAALAAGKTILFVSEKLTALEVVRRRLDSAGLGLFCLELHSHKVKKDVFHGELRKRLTARSSFRDPAALDHQLAVVEESYERLKLLAKYWPLMLGLPLSLISPAWFAQESF